MRTHNPSYARSEYHTQLAKMSFDKIFDLTAGVYFNFYIISEAGSVHDSQWLRREHAEGMASHLTDPGCLNELK